MRMPRLFSVVRMWRRTRCRWRGMAALASCVEHTRRELSRRSFPRNYVGQLPSTVPRSRAATVVYRCTRKDGATGIDGQTAQEYAGESCESDAPAESSEVWRRLPRPARATRAHPEGQRITDAAHRHPDLRGQSPPKGRGDGVGSRLRAGVHDCSYTSVPSTARSSAPWLAMVTHDVPAASSFCTS
jgi:hypothetical protein